MDVDVQKLRYGPSSRQYVLLVNQPGIALRDTNCLAVYFHGGAWTFGRPEWFLPAARPWLELGFTVALPSHRRPPRVGLRRIVDDCWSALDAALDGEDTDGSAIARPKLTEFHLGGISAGAHLAAVLATDAEGLSARGLFPDRVLLNAGPLSFAEMPAYRLFLPRYASIDPLTRLAPRLWHDMSTDAPATAPNWLLVHGTRDRMVSIRHSEAFYARLLELGHRAQFRRIPGGNHVATGRWMFDAGERERILKWLGPKER